jgi:hypothetical protein
LAPGRLQFTGDELQQGALARTIDAHHTPTLASLQLGVYSQ